MSYTRPYEEEFKKRAVEMLRTSGKSRKQLARELGCGVDSLSTWKQKYDNPLQEGADPKAASVEELQLEVKRLRKELAYTQEQREILKKAAAILGQ